MITRITNRLGCRMDGIEPITPIETNNVCAQYNAIKATIDPKDYNEYDKSYLGQFLPATNQGETPYCVIHEVSNNIERVAKKPISRLYIEDIYREAKKIDGLDGEGTTLRAGIQAAKNMGLWNGLKEIRLGNNWQAVINWLNLCPVMVAVRVYDMGWTFRVSMSIPKTYDNLKRVLVSKHGKYVGNHAITLGSKYIIDKSPYQYHMIKSTSSFINSWGLEWGVVGMASMRLEYLQTELLDAYAMMKE